MLKTFLRFTLILVGAFSFSSAFAIDINNYSVGMHTSANKPYYFSVNGGDWVTVTHDNPSEDIYDNLTSIMVKFGENDNGIPIPTAITKSCHKLIHQGTLDVAKHKPSDWTGYSVYKVPGYLNTSLPLNGASSINFYLISLGDMYCNNGVLCDVYDCVFEEK